MVEHNDGGNNTVACFDTSMDVGGGRMVEPWESCKKCDEPEYRCVCREKTSSIDFDLTGEELIAIGQACVITGETLSEFIVRAVMTAAEKHFTCKVDETQLQLPLAQKEAQQ
jgi:uncharacterized protein (DUF1778 family)